MANIKLDLAGFKHVKSDDKSTTLKHEKLGHTVTLSHNVLSPDNQKVLKALAGSEAIKHDHGKVTKKFDEGGKVPAPAQTDSSTPQQKDEKPVGANVNTPSSMDDALNRIKNAWAEGGEVGTADANLPCLNPNCKSHGKPHPNCKCHGGMAKGGTVLRYCAHGKPHVDGCEYGKGTSIQGKDVRSGDMPIAKEEAKGRAAEERHVKPNIKRLATGGSIQRYAEGTGDAQSEDSLGKIIGEAIRHARPAPSGGPMPTSAPQDEADTEADMDATANQPPQAAVPQMQGKGPVMQPGMPGADEPQGEQPDADTPPTNQPDQAQAPNPSAPQIQSPPDQGPSPQEQQANPQLMNSTPANQEYSGLKEHTKQRYLEEDQAFAHDLNNGHITPKTYNELMYYNKDGEEKSTLGKIGSLFGLLLSGAGSGLAHQPNAVLHMMDQTIQRDVEAQQKSKDNAMNFVKLNQARILQQAQIPRLVAEGKATNAQAAVLMQDAKLKASTLAQMQAYRSSAHSIMEAVKQMPPGPGRDQAATAASAIVSGLDNMHADLADKNAALTAALAEGSDKNTNLQKVAALSGNPALTARANQQSARTIPGIKGEASRDIPEGTRQQITAMQVLDDKGKDLLGFIQQHKGTLNLKNRAIAAQKIEEMKNFYNDSIKGGALTQGRLGWYDEQFAKNPTDYIPNILGSSAKLKEMVSSNANRRDMELKALGLKPSGNPLSAIKPGQTITNKQTGEQKQWNGKSWVSVK